MRVLRTHITGVTRFCRRVAEVIFEGIRHQCGHRNVDTMLELPEATADSLRSCIILGHIYAWVRTLAALRVLVSRLEFLKWDLAKI